MVPWTCSIALTASSALPPDSPRACCCASSRNTSCSFSRISPLSRSRVERWATGNSPVPRGSGQAPSSSLRRDRTNPALSPVRCASRLVLFIQLSRRPVRRSSSVVRIRLFSMNMSCWWRMPERWPFFSSTSFKESEELVPGALRALAVLPDLVFEVPETPLPSRLPSQCSSCRW